MHALAEHKTHNEISLIRVNNEKELLRYNVDQLAKEIHGCSVPRTFPLFLVYYHDQIRGYIQMHEQMVVFPAIHPEMLDAKDFVRVVRDLVIECKRMYGNPLFLLCDVAERLGPRHMATLRLKKAEETAYVYTEEND